MRKKFTLVEILVVISVIIIVLAIITPSSISYLQKIKAKNCHLMIQQINLAIKSYNNDFSTYFPIPLSQSNDYSLSEMERQSLFQALTGFNTRNYNYLPNAQLENNEIKDPWGFNYEIIINDPEGTTPATTAIPDPPPSTDPNKIDLSIINNLDCRNIIDAFNNNKKDYIIYAITPKISLSTLDPSTDLSMLQTNGCIHSLADSFK